MTTHSNIQILSDIFAIAEEINRSSSVEEIQNLVLNKLDIYGVKYVFAGIIPLHVISSEEQLSNVIFGNWPDEWVKRYFKYGYLEQDPTIHHLRHSNNVLSWRAIFSKSSVVMNEASDFKLQDGITIPMMSIDGVKLGMSFAGEQISQSPDCAALCQYISAISTARIIELQKKIEKRNGANFALTQAEYNCLGWVAEGKTNSEIGDIMSISDKTVEKHLSSCLAKTNSTNRTQLVATSLRCGIIN